MHQKLTHQQQGTGSGVHCVFLEMAAAVRLVKWGQSLSLQRLHGWSRVPLIKVKEKEQKHRNKERNLFLTIAL